MTDTASEIRELGRRWAEAERSGDLATLEALSTGDFTLVGAAGFVLDREQRLAGYRSGALQIQALSWDDVEVREYGEAAVAIGVRAQEASYQGHPAGGRFRGTHVAVRRDGRWLMAGVHVGPMAGPPAR